LADLVEIVHADPHFAALQNRVEILALLELLQPRAAQRVVEIGTAAGGTILFFSRVAAPDAVLVTVDSDNTPARAEAIAALARRGQSLVAVEGDSRADTTFAQVCACLGRSPIDFLFLDGDHRFAGVRGDFERYAPLVRPGGLVALHDIRPTTANVGRTSDGADKGDVPRFWNLLKQQGFVTRELIDTAQPDSPGIGVIEWDGSLRAASKTSDPDHA
jgi:predicted O-methyltransferase YrrM